MNPAVPTSRPYATQFSLSIYSVNRDAVTPLAIFDLELHDSVWTRPNISSLMILVSGRHSENYSLDKVSLLANLLAIKVYHGTIILARGYVSHDTLNECQIMCYNETRIEFWAPLALGTYRVKKNRWTTATFSVREGGQREWIESITKGISHDVWNFPMTFPLSSIRCIS